MKGRSTDEMLYLVKGDASLAKVQRMFNTADKDGSGQIDADEFCKLFKLEKNSYTERLLNLFDVDSDGSVSVSEFIIGMARYVYYRGRKAQADNCLSYK